MHPPLYLVRHGQSEWNARRLTQGQISHPRLTARGRREALAAARRVEADLLRLDRSAASVVTSDLVRALETAEAVAAVLCVSLRTDRRLREQDLGSLQGRSYDETLAAAEGHDWSDPDLPLFGGESQRQVQDRMRDFVLSLPPDRVTVAVSHGDAIRAALAWADGHEAHEAPWVEVRNGSVVRLESGSASWL